MDNNLIMIDVETKTTWPQILAVGNAGPRKGECLEYGRNTVATTWDFWQRMHPETVVLTNQNNFQTVIEPRFYNTNPYDDYHKGFIGPPHEVSVKDDRRPSQEIVLGVHAGDGRAAVVMTKPVGETMIGSTPTVLFHDPESNTTFAFENNFDGASRRFFPHDPDENGIPRFRDNAGSVWSMDGIGLEGPDTGMRMSQMPALTLYWFAWAAFYPGAPIVIL